MVFGVGRLFPLPPPLSRPRRYALALGFVALATLLRAAVDPLVHDQEPYFLYVAAVVVTTWFGGTDAGLLAVVFGGFAGNFFFLAPRYDLGISSSDATAMAVFAGLGLGLVWLVGRWRHAERRTRRLHYQTTVVLQQVPVGVIIADARGKLLFGNAALERIFRHPFIASSDPTGYSAYEAYHPDGRPLATGERVMSRALTGHSISGEEVHIVRGDGARGVLSVSGTPIRDEDGAVIGGVIAMHDITELEAATEALRQSESRFRSVLDGSRDVIYRFNIQSGRYEYVSPAAMSLVGFSPEEFAAATAQDMVHPDDRAVLAEAARRLESTGHEEVEYRQRTKAGDYRWLSNHMSLGRDAHGRPLFRDGVIRDVTGQKSLEAALRQQAQALEQANRVKDEFLATLSHELRTPLNAILGWSDMLLRPGLPADTQRKGLESIKRNAHAQAALISDILDVSRIIAGKLRLDLRPVDVAEVVNAACEAVQPAAAARGVEVRASIEGRPVLIADGDRLQQIAWNLLSNSVKFCRRGGQIDVTVARAGSRLRLSVRDDGAGIAPEFLPHVFERFRQADPSTTRGQEGLGLGLALVRSLTELHGGTVSAASEGLGKGALFTVDLPIPAVLDGTGTDLVIPPARDENDVVPPGCLRGLQIVAVDDHDEARMLVQAVLERYGADVTVCVTAEDAVRAVERHRPHLLLADIGMPGIDGYGLLRRVRVLPGCSADALPAVALTAYGGAHDREQALAAGFAEHLTKPTMPSILVSVIAGLTGRASST